MQSWIVFRVENTVKQSWMIFYCLPHQRKHNMNKLEDLLKALLRMD